MLLVHGSLEVLIWEWREKANTSKDAGRKAVLVMGED